MAGQGPLIPRRRLGAELRGLREAAGMHLEDAAAHLECSTSKISRLETGQGIPKSRDVRDLLALYGMTDQKAIERLLRWASDGRRQGWWRDYGDVVSPNTDMFLSMESEVTRIRSFVHSVIPGLLQTEDYAAALFDAIYPRAKPGENEQRVELRMERQRAVARREEPPRMNLIIDEATLHRKVGSNAVMRAQLAYLVEVSRKAEVTLLVFPFDNGPDIATQCTFVIFTFDSDYDRNAVNVELSLDDRWLEQETEVTRYTRIFDELAKKCLDPEGSRAFIGELAKKYN